MAKAEKLFVWCFQSGLGVDAPFLAELVKETAQQAILKVGRKELKANRGACSSIAYIQADLDKYGTSAPVPVKAGSSEKQQKPSGALKGFFS